MNFLFSNPELVGELVSLIGFAVMYAMGSPRTESRERRDEKVRKKKRKRRAHAF
jgi:hypothetical protein